MKTSLPVLLAYGSKHGATREIAERIGKVLRDAGLAVEVKAAKDAGALTGYRAVVLGSGLYVGAWVKDAANFLKKRADELAGLPVWLFSSGPTGAGDPAELLDGKVFPAKLAEARDRAQPRDSVLFHGAIDPVKLNFLEKHAIRMVDAPVGDYRDWDTIEAWARGIAEELKREA
ncbi:flavodoxin domain-containing protein [candidate division WOR-3 bacterium]|nr:flavodoxin domain-containing protein [candidate division WOR-3 bacterium]